MYQPVFTFGVIIFSAVICRCLSILMQLCLDLLIKKFELLDLLNSTRKESASKFQKENASKLHKESASKFQKRRFRMRNVSVSLIHSIVGGFGALIAFFLYPEMCDDLINHINEFTYYLALFSIGYFIYDALDMLGNDLNYKTIELLGHHFIVIICFGISCFTRRYIGYVAVALLIELNSIFLHSRQLLNLFHVEKSATIFRVVSLFNIATFVTCRIATMAWMTRWLLLHRDLIPLAFYSCGSIGLATLTVVNVVLFYRILYADFFTFTKKTSVPKPVLINGVNGVFVNETKIVNGANGGIHVNEQKID